MEWNDLKVLLALSRGGSVAGAARELKVDHSTISRRLAALEEAAGAKLINRGGREFAWTSEGRTLLEAAEATEALTAAALRAVRASKIDVEGIVRVSVAPAFIQPLVKLLLPELRRTHPLLSVQLDGSYQRVDLAKGEADIALRMARPDEADFVARRAMECAWRVYAAASYLDARGRPLMKEELSRHELILYADRLLSAPPMRWLETYKNPAQAASRVDSVETACQAAAAGGGIAVVPCFVGDLMPELERVFPDSVATNTGWVVYHESLRDAARIRVVADALVELCEKHASLFTGD
jgi:DNA-binding transcriptional LysR family regulator